ncbi:hypothetical protein EDB80DRAFT_719272 [Ilyonectria destructans]|nr:hypothetical protein EDB80DRAFT_719272 [Ilyonectria destructans]
MTAHWPILLPIFVIFLGRLSFGRRSVARKRGAEVGAVFRGGSSLLGDWLSHTHPKPTSQCSSAPELPWAVVLLGDQCHP